MDKIISKSLLNEKLQKSMMWFYALRKSFKFYFLLIVYLAVMLYMFLVVFPTLTGGGDSLFFYVMIVLATLVVPTTKFFTIANSVSKLRKLYLHHNEMVEITKAKIDWKIEKGGEERNDGIVLSWNQIMSACEVKGAFYFYLDNKGNGFLIDKNTIIKGDIYLLRKLIINNIGKTKRGKLLYKKYFKEND